MKHLQCTSLRNKSRDFVGDSFLYIERENISCAISKTIITLRDSEEVKLVMKMAIHWLWIFGRLY